MKVFIVFELSTSNGDSRIVGVYSTREKAEGVAATMKGTVHCGGDHNEEVNTGDIDEFELDETTQRPRY